MIKRLLPALLLFGAVPLSAQVTSSAAAGDVRPGDPAFLTLQRLVERYGCVAGYPGATYRGNRPLTRYEFAAGLNACSDRVRQLNASGQSVDGQDQADMTMLEQAFAPELATLRGRTSTLEGRTNQLEAQRFGTRKKLGKPGGFQLDPNGLQKPKRRRPAGPGAAPPADGTGGTGGN